ncbi:riboflavin synthase [Candidatus Gracilibacteria bacterium]|nr:riboflavin synthase [Candidatus Gracilibacteria bacterium]
MFSGIIEHKAKILFRDGGLFRVENTFEEPLHIGQSIAHDGACMTLTRVDTDAYEFFVMEESLSITNFCDKLVSHVFNVERSLKLSDRLDGHMVSGHVDTVGKIILKKYQEDGSCLLGVSFDREYDALIIRKGSITINGVSLTIVDRDSGTLTVSLIPLTQDWTNLGEMNLGERVNLEFDMIGKYAARFFEIELQERGKSV